MDRGDLVPDDVTIRMIMERIRQTDCAQGCLLDGFPRTLEQARALDEALAAQGQEIHRVLYLEVSEEELLDRLGGRWICRQCQAPYHLRNSPPKVAGKCDVCGGELYQRPDDSLETAQNRLKVYFAQTAPLIQYYRQSGKLVEAAGEGPIEQVGQELLAALK